LARSEKTDRSVSEFSLASLLYFNEQYFTKIDKDVRSYYSIEIDLSE